MQTIEFVMNSVTNELKSSEKSVSNDAFRTEVSGLWRHGDPVSRDKMLFLMNDCTVYVLCRATLAPSSFVPQFVAAILSHRLIILQPQQLATL